MTYFVYIAQCADKTYYCGYTTDIKRRETEHNSSKKGAKYTHNKRPITIKYFEEYQTLSESLKREYQLKKLTHTEKAQLTKSATLHPMTSDSI